MSGLQSRTKGLLILVLLALNTSFANANCAEGEELVCDCTCEEFTCSATDSIGRKYAQVDPTTVAQNNNFQIGNSTTQLLSSLGPAKYCHTKDKGLCYSNSGTNGNTLDSDGCSDINLQDTDCSAILYLRTTFPTSPSEGMLLHGGGNGRGMWMGFKANSTGHIVLRYRGGDGSNTVDVDAQAQGVAVLDVHDFPTDGEEHDLMLAIGVGDRTSNLPGYATMYIDGVFKGQNIAPSPTTQLCRCEWSGGNAGTYGVKMKKDCSNDHVPKGEPDSAWPGELISPLFHWPKDICPYPRVPTTPPSDWTGGIYCACPWGNGLYNDVCESCPVGTFQDTPSASPCQNCSAGTYQESTGASSCVSCPADSWCPGRHEHYQCANNSASMSSSTSQLDCICVPGYGGPNGGPCSRCQVNTYCQNGIVSNCPANSSSLEGSDNIVDCVCDSGFHGQAGASCSQCPSNSYCSGGASINACTSNSVSAPGSTSISACRCVDGYYGGGGSPCIACESGYWCEGGIRSACPAYADSPPLSSSQSNCTCNAGYQGDEEGCSECPAGTIKPNHGPSSCIECAENTYSINSTTCGSCPGHTVSPVRSGNISMCECTAGYFSSPGLFLGNYYFMKNALTENPDVTGLVPDATNWTSTIYFDDHESFAELVPELPEDRFAIVWTGHFRIYTTGTYTFYTTSDDGSHVWINGQLVVDNGGLHGSRTESGVIELSSGIHSLKADFFENRGGQRMRVEYMGTDTNQQRVPITSLLSIGCEKCAPGTYKGFIGQETCNDCPTNSISPHGSTSISQCICGPGYFQNSMGDCEACMAGTFKPTNGSAECTRCGAGKFSTGLGKVLESTCVDCPSNSHSDLGSSMATNCTCNKGYTGADGESCDGCEAGTYKPTNGSAECTRCGAGKFSTGVSEVLESTCVDCPSNSHSDLGSSMVTNCTCNKGYTGADGESCDGCEAGTYKPTNGSADCSFCSSGTYSQNTAEVSDSACLECPLNSHSSLVPVQFQFVGWVVWEMDCATQSFHQMDQAMDQACKDKYGASSMAVSEELWFSGQVRTDTADPELLPRDHFLTFSDMKISSDCQSPGSVPQCTATGGIARRCFRSSQTPLPGACHDQAYPCWSSTNRQAMCALIVGSLLYPNGFPLSHLTNCTCNKGYTGADGSLCTPCPPGTFKPSNGSVACTKCTAGKYSTAEAQTSEGTCVACPRHTYSDFGSHVLTNCTCNKGFYGPDGFQCQACVAGTFKPENGSIPCSLCPAGKYSTGLAKILADTCEQCPIFSHSDFGSGNVTNCTCNMGYTGADGTECQACASGTYKDSNGSIPCDLCSVGTYSTGIAQVRRSTCIQCPEHTTSALGSDGLGDCVCIKGYTGPDGEACTECDTGTYKSTLGSEQCSICSSGKYSTAVAQVNSTTCLDCPFATDSAPGSDNVLKCTCNAGYTGLDGQACVACLRGTFKLSSGSQACSECAAGKYSESAAAVLPETCITCPDHTHSDHGSGWTINCTCNRGYYGVDGTRCTACESGKYKPANGSSDCIPCSAGLYSTALASETVLSCLTCPKDSSSPMSSNHITDCVCNAGFTGPNGETCSGCQAGKFKVISGSQHCSTCPSNTYSTQIAANKSEVCSACPLDSSSTVGSSKLTNCSCPAGYSGPDGEACQPCPFGTYKDHQGPTLCSLCPEGKYGGLRALKSVDECEACPENSRSTPGSTLATDCICMKGFTTLSSSDCEACPAGTYKDVNGSSPCSLCPANTFSGSVAANSSSYCGPCPAFTSSVPGTVLSMNCTCERGYGFAGAGLCEPCSSGSYKNKSANEVCSPCEPGSFSDLEGAFTCQICAVGYTSETGAIDCQLLPPITTNSTPAPPAQLIVNETNNTVVEQVQALGQTVATAAAVAVSTNVAVSVAASVATSVGASVGAAASGSVASSSAASAGSSGSTMTVLNQVQFLAIMGGASGGESEAASSYSESFGWAMMDTPVDFSVGGGSTEATNDATSQDDSGARRRRAIIARFRRSGMLHQLFGRRKKTTSGLGQEAEDFTFEGTCDDVGSVLLEKVSAAGVMLLIVFIFRNLIWLFILCYTGQHSHELVFPAWEGPIAIFEFFPIAEIAAATFGQFCTGWSVISGVTFVLGPGTLLVLSYHLVRKYMKKGKLNFEFHRSFDQRLEEIEKEKAEKGKSGIWLYFHRLHVRYLKFTNGGGWDITHKEARFWAFTFGDFRDTVFLFFAWQLMMKLCVSISMHVIGGTTSPVLLSILYFTDMVMYFWTWPFIDGLNNVGSAVCGVTNFFSVAALSLPRIFPSVDWNALIPEFMVVMVATMGMFATLVVSTIKPAFGAAQALANLPCWGVIFGCLGGHAFFTAAAAAGREGGAQFLVGLAAEEVEDKAHEKAHGRGIGDDNWEEEEGKKLQEEDDFDLMYDTPTAAILVHGPHYIPRDPKSGKPFAVTANLAYLESAEEVKGSTSPRVYAEPTSKVHQLPSDVQFQKVIVSREQRANPFTISRSYSSGITPKSASSASFGRALSVENLVCPSDAPPHIGRSHSMDAATSAPLLSSTMDDVVNSFLTPRENLATLFHIPPPRDDPLTKMKNAVEEATKHVLERKKRRAMEPESIEPFECTVRLNLTDASPDLKSRFRSAVAKSAESLKSSKSLRTSSSFRTTSSATKSSKGLGRTSSKFSRASSKPQGFKRLKSNFLNFKRSKSSDSEAAQDLDLDNNNMEIEMETEKTPTEELKDMLITALNDVDCVLRSDQVHVEQEDEDQFLITLTNSLDVGPSTISADQLAISIMEQSVNKQSRLSKHIARKFTLTSAERVSNDGIPVSRFLDSNRSDLKKRRVSDPEHHLARLTSGRVKVDRTGSTDEDGVKYCYRVSVGVEHNAANLASFRSKRQAVLASQSSVRDVLGSMTERTGSGTDRTTSSSESEGSVIANAIMRAMNDVDVITRSDQIDIDDSNCERVVVSFRDTTDTGPNSASAKELINNFLEQCDNEASRFKKLLRSTPYKITSAEIIDRRKLSEITEAESIDHGIPIPFVTRMPSAESRLSRVPSALIQTTFVPVQAASAERRTSSSVRAQSSQSDTARSSVSNLPTFRRQAAVQFSDGQGSENMLAARHPSPEGGRSASSLEDTDEYQAFMDDQPQEPQAVVASNSNPISQISMSRLFDAHGTSEVATIRNDAAASASTVMVSPRPPHDVRQVPLLEQPETFRPLLPTSSFMIGRHRPPSMPVHNGEVAMLSGRLGSSNSIDQTYRLPRSPSVKVTAGFQSANMSSDAKVSSWLGYVETAPAPTAPSAPASSAENSAGSTPTASGIAKMPSLIGRSSSTSHGARGVPAGSSFERTKSNTSTGDVSLMRTASFHKSFKDTLGVISRTRKTLAATATSTSGDSNQMGEESLNGSRESDHPSRAPSDVAGDNGPRSSSSGEK